MVPPLSWSQVPKPKMLTAGSANKSVIDLRAHWMFYLPLTRDPSATHVLRDDVLRLTLSAEHCTDEVRNDVVRALGRALDQVGNSCGGLAGNVCGLTRMEVSE